MATTLKDNKLINATAPAALAAVLAGGRCVAGDNWSKQLTDWRARLQSHTSLTAHNYPLPTFGALGQFCHPYGPCTPQTYHCVWTGGIGEAVKRFGASPGFEKNVGEAARADGVCMVHKEMILGWAAALEKAYEQGAPPFVT